MAWVPWVVVPALLAINAVAHLCNVNSWPRRRLATRGWTGAALLALANRADGVAASQPPASFWAWDLIDPCHCVTPVLIPAWALLALRLSALPYFATYFLVRRFADNALHSDWLVFFTNWSFVVFAASMALGAAHLAVHLWQQRRTREGALAGGAAAGSRQEEPAAALLGGAGGSEAPAAGAPADLPATAHGGAVEADVELADGGASDATKLVRAGPTAPEWGLLAKAHLLAAEVACSAELFLAGFYWALLYDGDNDGPMGTNLMVHGLNLIFMLADVALSRLPFVSYHFQAVLLYGTTYQVFMWIYYGATGIWAYSTLDWAKPSSLLYYLLLPCLLALAFFFFWGLAWARERALQRQHWRRQQHLQAAAAAVELQEGSPVGGGD
ncbi:rolling stone [Micractinium conductrix]|uniref:Rolling stone n=1 Tax=Micractinium conductrix TaxID=554055 RepID=A0A2P6VNP4_9CHLO|nr:rolling stone [Micractinium conductrix]|eukprot:PSC75714.1 rolling stone [Micractinium conductrix]